MHIFEVKISIPGYEPGSTDYLSLCFSRVPSLKFLRKFLAEKHDEWKEDSMYQCFPEYKYALEFVNQISQESWPRHWPSDQKMISRSMRQEGKKYNTWSINRIDLIVPKDLS